MNERWDSDGEFDWHDDVGNHAMEPEESTEESPPAPHRRSRLKVWGAVITTAALGVGVGDVIKHTHILKKSNNSYYVNIFPNVITRTTIDNSTPACPDISHQELGRVRNVLREPGNPAIETLKERFSGSDKIRLQDSSQYRLIAEKAARENGFTLIDERPYIKRVEAAAFEPRKQLEIFNEFTRQYGFSVSIDIGKSSDGIKAFAPWEAPNYDFADAFYNLANALRYMPVEEVKATGLKHLMIVKDFTNPNGKNNDVAAMAIPPGKMEATIGSLVKPDAAETVYHELGHLDDYKFCGQFGFNYYDPQYDELNPDNFEYGTGGYWRNATISPYGASNIREDKAEESIKILGGLNYGVAHDSYRTVRLKYDLLLARLEKQIPGITRYLQAISDMSRPS